MSRGKITLSQKSYLLTNRFHYAITNHQIRKGIPMTLEEIFNSTDDTFDKYIKIYSHIVSVVSLTEVMQKQGLSKDTIGEIFKLSMEMDGNKPFHEVATEIAVKIFNSNKG